MKNIGHIFCILLLQSIRWRSTCCIIQMMKNHLCFLSGLGQRIGSSPSILPEICPPLWIGALTTFLWEIICSTWRYSSSVSIFSSYTCITHFSLVDHDKKAKTEQKNDSEEYLAIAWIWCRDWTYIAIDVAVAALEYLHHGNEFPIVHCDLKPSY